MWESFVGCKAFSELASLQIGCSTLKTTLKSSEWRRSVDISVLFSEVFRVGQPTCKLESSEMALQPINGFHINMNLSSSVSPKQCDWVILTAHWWYVHRQTQ